jgi:hypothetical protein
MFFCFNSPPQEGAFRDWQILLQTVSGEVLLQQHEVRDLGKTRAIIDAPLHLKE